MYIGVWPEYHLAKVVAKSDAGEKLSQGDLLPPFARVDVLDPEEAAQESYRRALEASRREQAARLPPIPPNSRPTGRSLSKPSVWHPPLPESSPPTHSRSRHVACGRRTSSVPPGDRTASTSAAARPQSDRAPQRRRAEAAGVPEAPRLAQTPPWRSSPPKPSGQMPSWIAQMRSGVEATRQLFRGESPGRSFSTGKLRPLETEGSDGAGSPANASIAWNASPHSHIKPKDSKELKEMVTSPASPVSPVSTSRFRQGAMQDAEVEAVPQMPSSVGVMTALQVDEEEEALIAWSQALCLDEIELDSSLLLP